MEAGHTGLVFWNGPVYVLTPTTLRTDTQWRPGLSAQGERLTDYDWPDVPVLAQGPVVPDGCTQVNQQLGGGLSCPPWS